MQTKIDHQKYVADTVLSKLRLLDTWCIVAGGAPRDWYLGNEAKDIDVYLYDSRKIYIHADLREGLLKELGFEIESKHEDWTVPELYQSNHLVRHLYNSTFLGEKVQIIFMGEPTFTSVVDMFPISISKVWYKGGVINTTDDFDLSVKHKILYKTRDNYAEDDKYLLKIREKFSDYTYMTEEEAYKLEQNSEETKAEESKMKIELNLTQDQITLLLSSVSLKHNQLNDIWCGLAIKRNYYSDIRYEVEEYQMKMSEIENLLKDTDSIAKQIKDQLTT